MTAPATGVYVPPPLRANPSTPDSEDGNRIAYYRGLWRSQDEALRARDRQIEENVRMLAGQQWLVWHPLMQRYYDITQFFTDHERRWRQRPVVNRLLNWFILTHARLTENPPIVTFIPGPDRVDAELAEVMDTAAKTVWRDADMVDVVDRLMAWLIVGGEAYLGSRIDLTKGPWRDWVGVAEVPVVDANGEPMPGEDGRPMTVELPDVPLDRDEQPLMVITPDGPQVLGEPHSERVGSIAVDVYSAMEVRGEWGPRPWQDKKWHATVAWMSPDQIQADWGVTVDPKTPTQQVSDTGTLDRVLFGSGYFGAAEQRVGSSVVATGAKRDLIPVWTFWCRPLDEVSAQRLGLPEMVQTKQSPGGRLIAFTDLQVLYDGPRPVAFPYTSPLRRFEFVRLPGRPSGSTPQEAMNGIQRHYNKLRSQIAEHANLVSNPKFLIDQAAGVQAGQWTNEPGTGLTVMRRAGVPAIEWMTPPALGKEVYDSLSLAREEIEEIGSLKGTQGAPLSPEQSGEAIKELRFNSDRFLGPTVRRAVEEFGRLVEDWMALLKVIWDEPTVVQYAGEDNIAKTVTVMPYMFEQGRVHVVPDVESMLPDGRGERQQRAYRMYLDGVFGMPGSPEAVRTLLDIARFPHLSRTAKPGGVDRTTAEQENGQLLSGANPMEIPVFEWYNHLVHLDVHESYMKSPEFKKQNPAVQQAFAIHRAMHMNALIAMLPPPPPEGGGAGGKKPGGKGDDPSSKDVQPDLPAAPARAAIPGGVMPTVGQPVAE